MARETFLSTRDDLKWLRETHLKSCRKLPRFSVAILHGNEDAPDSITLYERNHVDSKSVTLRADSDGNFSCETPTRTRKNPVGKDGVLRLGGKMVTVPMKESKRLKPQVYGYRVDLNERGAFRAGVQDANGNDVWTVQNDDERDGEIPEIEDGWMKHWNDGAGLQNP